MIVGYIFTLAYVILFSGLILSGLALRKEIWKKISSDTAPACALLALILIAFFVSFSLLYVSPVEQLYFDENIYQGIALNILHSGNALWCQYGTALVKSCPYSQIYHDPVEISFYIAIAFAIFGIGIQTAYGMSIFVGAVSIFLVFLLASSLFGKRAGLASAIVFSLIPELFIWSRTQAVPDLMFMMFSILAFYAYEIYRGSKSNTTLAFFLFALGISVYVRIEAILLIPIFIAIAAYEASTVHGVKKGIGKLLGHSSTRTMAIMIMFFILIVPEIYYIFYEIQNLNYGNGTLCGVQTNTTFSISNFKCNIVPNADFFLGAFNHVSYYPVYFSVLTTIIAVIGAIVMMFKVGKKGIPILLLGLWILVFYIFYSAFYAGSVLFGVDVRFMLIIYPAISIFAGFGIATLSNGIPVALKLFRAKNGESKRAILSVVIFAVLIILFAVLPFYNSLKIVTISPANMPQEVMPMSATNFIYQNTFKVPSNCLVFSFTPDVWWEQNRSAAQIGWLGNGNSTFTSFENTFTCFFFDKGYWCTTPEYKSGLCSTDLSTYNTTLIATQRSPNLMDNYSLYYINGYNT